MNIEEKKIIPAFFPVTRVQFLRRVKRSGTANSQLICGGLLDNASKIYATLGVAKHFGEKAVHQMEALRIVSRSGSRSGNWTDVDAVEEESVFEYSRMLRDCEAGIGEWQSCLTAHEGIN